MTRTWFLDTGFVIALVSPRDRHHAIAQQLSETIEASDIRLVTSQAVILEIGAALSKAAFRKAAVQTIQAIQGDSIIDIVQVENELLRRAFGLFKDRSDKEWSLADCVSFEIMRDRRITEALSPDIHFTQAGYSALMRI